MVATVAKGKGKNTATETVATPPVEQTATHTSGTNGDTPTAHKGLEAGKTYTGKEYREACGFNLSKYLRELVTADPEITTEDVAIKLAEEHPQLTFKKEGLGQVLSNTKTAMRKAGEEGKAETSKHITMENVVAAKQIVKDNGGIDVLLASLEAYRKFKTMADAFGGEEKAVKILEVMDALRKE